MSETVFSSRDWKPCTIIRKPVALTISGASREDEIALANLIQMMLAQTKLTNLVTVRRTAR